MDAVAIKSRYFSLPLCGLYVFSQWFCCSGRAVFPHVLYKLYSLIHFGTVIFPRCWLCCRGLPYIFGTVVISPESHFGHDRAKNDSKNVFPVLSCKQLIDFRSEMVGLRSVLGEGMGASFA